MKRAIFAAIVLAAAAQAWAQSDDELAHEHDAYRLERVRFEHAREDAMERSPVVFSRIDSSAQSWIVLAFGRAPARGDEWPRVWGARMVRDHVAYAADSDTCPAMRAALRDMERLTPPRIDLPGIGRNRSSPAATMDGDENLLWTDLAVFDGPRRGGELAISGNADTALAAWADSALAALDPCWAPED